MPYLIKSKSINFLIRDIWREGKPMLMVGTEWVPFFALPENMSPHGDGDVDVREIDTLEGRNLPPPVNAPEKPARKEEVESEHDKPRGKGRLR